MGDTAALAVPRRLRLLVAYDGTDFWGAQVQPGRRTVGGELAAAFRRITGDEPRIILAGRTDRGVHAAGQVAHLDSAATLGDERLGRAINAALPRDLAVMDLATVAADFHARYDACWREYRYRIWNAPVRSPLLARTTWHLERPLDVAALRAATATLIGEHDFAAFAGQGLGGPARDQGRSTIRRVLLADWADQAPGLPGTRGRIAELRIRATGFLPQMVRTIVGTAVEVGLGRRDPGWVATILRGRERALAPAPAPPQGLTLWRVGYGQPPAPSAGGGDDE